MEEVLPLLDVLEVHHVLCEFGVRQRCVSAHEDAHLVDVGVGKKELHEVGAYGSCGSHHEDALCAVWSVDVRAVVGRVVDRVGAKG